MMHKHLTTSNIQARRRTEEDLRHYKQEFSTIDHRRSLGDLCDKYHTDTTRGLTKTMAKEMLLSHGPNALTPVPVPSTFILLIKNLFGGFGLLLWAGSMLCYTSYLIEFYTRPHAENDMLYMGTVLFVVVVITGVFSFYQEAKNTKIMDSFTKLVPRQATVIRDGEKQVINCDDVVLGDLVEIRAGDSVPADIRIIECTNLKVDNSTITGESEPQPRSNECTDINPLETTNLAFFSTYVIEGTGRGIVIACGDDTLMGMIAGLTSGTQSEETPIHKEVRNFIKVITYIAFGLGGIFFAISLLMGTPWTIAIIFIIGIIVANVPEGMPIAMTACLTLTAKKMATKNCLVRNLEAVETLGSTSIICSDKTGTLTQNKMTVSHIWFNNQIFESDTSYLRAQAVLTDYSDEVFKRLLKVAALCNVAEFKNKDTSKPIQQREVLGDASETAIFKFAERILGDGKVMAMREANPKLCEIPFNSTNKFQVSIHAVEHSKRCLLVMKGAPEIVLLRCSTLFCDNTKIWLSPEERKNIRRACIDLGGLGERVLGFCDLLLPESFTKDFEFNTDVPNFPLQGLEFVGLASLMDPPRPNVPDAVAKCKSAGIRVIMVTGDHPITASAIAKMVGIISPESETIYEIAAKRNTSVSEFTPLERRQCAAVVLTGAELKEMREVDIISLIKHHTEIVFARTSPQQKMIIVEACQKTGAVVAVTGDGVNDSPAMKKADIGIAMGIAGSDVAKLTADMILLDDNFASIVVGIEEGRLIFDNMKKTVAYLLTSNVPEVIPFLAFATMGIPQPLGVIAIICIDVGTDLWPAISLAYETAESDIMHRMPRKPKQDRLVNCKLIAITYGQIGLIQTTSAFLNYFLIMAAHGFRPGRLIGLRAEWDSPYINDLQDSFGQEWTYEERKVLEYMGYTAFFASIVITQWADLLICKTRRLSLFQQGMYNNCALNSGLFCCTFVALGVVYIPGTLEALKMYPLPWEFWVPPLPYAIFIILSDEIRKYMIRKHPGGWVEQLTYY